MKSLFGLVLLTFVSSSLFAQGTPSASDQSFQKLVDECRQVIVMSSQPVDAATQGTLADGIACLSYLRGSLDMLSVMSLALSEQGPKTCIPPEATGEDLARVTVKYADAHPELLQEHKAIGALEALLVTYGCETGKPVKREPTPAPKRSAL